MSFLLSQSDQVSRLVKVPGIVISTTAVRAKATKVCLQCRGCRSVISNVPLPPGLQGYALPRKCNAWVLFSVRGPGARPARCWQPPRLYLCPTASRPAGSSAPWTPISSSQTAVCASTSRCCGCRSRQTQCLMGKCPDTCSSTATGGSPLLYRLITVNQE